MNCEPKNQRTMTIMKHRPHGHIVAPFNELFNEYFGREFTHFLGSDDIQRNVPRVNIVERKDAFHLDLLAPGFSKEDLKLSFENDQLTISAEKKNEQLAEGERWTRREFGRSAFKRSFRLPENTSVEGIKAEYANGVLSVSIPKSEPVKPAAKEIAIG